VEHIRLAVGTNYGGTYAFMKNFLHQIRNKGQTFLDITDLDAVRTLSQERK